MPRLKFLAAACLFSANVGTKSCHGPILMPWHRKKNFKKIIITYYISNKKNKKKHLTPFRQNYKSYPFIINHHLPPSTFLHRSPLHLRSPWATVSSFITTTLHFSYQPSVSTLLHLLLFLPNPEPQNPHNHNHSFSLRSLTIAPSRHRHKRPPS